MKMWTAPNGAQFDLDDPAGCAAAYYLSGSLQNKHSRPWTRPPVVPCRVRLATRVHGDFPVGHMSSAEAGEYDCNSNGWGAVSIKASDGKMLGLRPHEFEPIAWRENEVTK